MDPGAASIALFFAIGLFVVALVVPLLEVGDWLASLALMVGFALLGALFVWLAVVAQ